jgi:hypothetical protein
MAFLANTSLASIAKMLGQFSKSPKISKKSFWQMGVLAKTGFFLASTCICNIRT